MKNKKGFTLIELLAVIVILAIIATIITPIMTGVIDAAENGAAETSASHFIKAVNNEIARQEMKGNPIGDGEYGLTEDGDLCADTECSNQIEIDASGDKPTAGIVLIKNGLVADGTEIIIKGINVNIVNGAGKVKK